MKTLPVISLFCVIGLSTQAQTRLDSLAKELPSTALLNNVDSAALNFVHLSDSLLPSFQKIDSIRQDFNVAADSIHEHYQSALAKINTTSSKLNSRIDSLNRLDLPTEKYKAKFDSLNGVRQNIETKFSSRLNELKSKTMEKLSALDLPPEYQGPLSDLTQKINGLNLDMDAIKIPELQIPGFSLPDIKGLTNLSDQVNGIGDVSNMGKLGEMGNGLPGQVQGYQNQVKDVVPGDLSQVTQQAQAYQQDIKNMAEGNVADMEKLPETLEQQASRIEGMEELQKQSGVMDEHKTALEDLKDPEKAKEKAVEVAKKAAVDHFAGKQEQLKAAMEKVSKYKQKYSSVSSLKDLPKRPPNPMKGKPFVERLIPGLYLQYQRKTFYLLDVNPYAGYKLTGRLSAGVGWNHRYAWDDKTNTFSPRSRIFGPRTYVDFKLGKGFIAHVEGETMNTFVPSTLRGNPDTGRREWVWSFMTGIKKEYKIYKNLKGTALIQYNLFNRYYKAPYVDRLNSRIGFEYVLKQGKKRKAEGQKQ